MADPVKGIADIHVHFMSHLGFGGLFIWGESHASDPNLASDVAIGRALHSPKPGYFSNLVNPERKDTNPDGYPTFQDWPHFSSVSYQQAYIDWIERAWRGGLRLVVCLADNSELFARRLKEHAPPELVQGFAHLPTNDREVVKLQIQALRALVRYVDQRWGNGTGKGWLQIADTPDKARAIIHAGKLAIVLGIEVDSLGGWRTPQDLQDDIDATPNTTAQDHISHYLDEVYDLGVRHILPLHHSNNAFGGAAIFRKALDAVNFYLTSQHFEVEDGEAFDVNYRLNEEALVDNTPEWIALNVAFGTDFTASNTIESFHQAAQRWAAVPNGHINKQGLTGFGEVLILEMMKKGMLLDIDHMSQKTCDRVLEIAEQHHYPVVSSHTHFRALKRRPDQTAVSGWHAAETSLSSRTVERIQALNGLVAPMLAQGNPQDCGCRSGVLAGMIQHIKSQVKNDSVGSSKSFAQAYLYALEKMRYRNVAIGSDVNGFASLPRPRFGSRASVILEADPNDDLNMETQQNPQQHPVRYQEAVPPSPTGASERQNAIWLALAAHELNVDPSQVAGPMGAAVLKQIELMAIGFKTKTRPALDISIQQQVNADDKAILEAAFLVMNQLAPNNPNPTLNAWLKLIQAEHQIWQRLGVKPNARRPAVAIQLVEARNPRQTWQEHDELKPSQAGERVFDYNTDGMAHYGLLPDFLQDLLNVGVVEEDLAVLYDSAEAYIQVWERCQIASTTLP